MAGPDKTTDFLNGEVPVQGAGAHEANGKGPTVQEFTAPVGSASDETKTFKCDVLVVGAGFSGIYAIHRFRQLGLNVKCFESGGDFGGVWYWNRYPGARVDSEAPYYQLNIPELYRDWTFSCRFPDHAELRKYMAHADKTLNLRKDTHFNARVVDATWDQASNLWTVRTLQGHQAQTKYLILTTGLLHRTYTPDFPGLDKYKGKLYHSGAWDASFQAAGKRVALVGAGATAVQITQELGKQAGALDVFVRRPSYCLPMHQRALGSAEQLQQKPYLPALFGAGRVSATGFPLPRRTDGVFDAQPAVREQLWEQLWAAGGFSFALGNYGDVGLNKEANRAVYDFWARKVRERLTDPAKQRVMAPDEPPYFFGTKRSPLEQDYYEVLNQSNVQVHDLNAVPLKEFAEKGLVMADGQLHEFDAVVLATGFDSYTGSLTNMGLKNRDGVELKELWKDGIHTYLGLTISGFPNVFMAYSPQAPTPLANGTTIIEIQLDTAADMVQKLEREGAATIEPRREAEQAWKAAMNKTFGYTLMQYTDSWWNGANIPGKTKEAMVYLGGVDNYETQCRATMEGWQGFDVKVGA